MLEIRRRVILRSAADSARLAELEQENARLTGVVERLQGIGEKALESVLAKVTQERDAARKQVELIADSINKSAALAHEVHTGLIEERDAAQRIAAEWLTQAQDLSKVVERLREGLERVVRSSGTTERYQARCAAERLLDELGKGRT
jgi:hypothetical protein